MVGEAPLTGLSRRALAGSAAVVVAVTLSACGSVAGGPTQKSNEVMCLDGLALPVTSGAQIFLDPQRIPDLRTQALAVLDSEAPDADVTESAHDVARKMIIVIDTVEGLDPDAGLGLLGSGLDALATLATPMEQLAGAHSGLAEVCSALDVTPSPSTSAV